MKILIVQLGRIGDMILATPMFRAVREHYPDAEIHVFAGEHNFSVIQNNPGINKVYVHKKTPLEYFKNTMAFRIEYYDFWLDAKDHYSTESKIFAKMSLAREKVGFNRPGENVFDFSIPSDVENKNLHYAIRAFNALIPLGIKCPETIPKPELFESPESIKYVNEFLKSLPGKPIILINNTASNQGKAWGIENWMKVVENINEELYNVVFIVPVYDKANIEQIKTYKSKIFKSRTISDAFSIIKRAKLLLTVDTSLVHIASAFNIPQIALYVNLEEFYNKFHPLSDVYQSILSEKGEVKIKNIRADEVINALNNILKKI